jgi:hypothetical protein
MQYVIDSYGMQELSEDKPIIMDSWSTSPVDVSVGVAFDINYIVRNTSASTSWAVFGYILDENNNIMNLSVWGSGTYTVAPNGTLSAPTFHHPAITGTVSRTIVVGHIIPGGTVRCYRCNPSTNVLEQYDFSEGTVCGDSNSPGWQSSPPTCGVTGCTNPSGTLNQIICGNASYTNAPDPTHRYQCNGTSWIDLGVCTYGCTNGTCNSQTGCTNPTGTLGQIICGNALYANTPDPTHQYHCNGTSWIDDGYSTVCDTAQSCTSPIGSHGQTICGNATYSQDPTHQYLCNDGTWVDQGYVATCDTCSYDTQGACLDGGCHWWNNACHSSPPTCEELDTQIECAYFKCYWYNNSCHSAPEPLCSDFNGKPDECVANGCVYDWNTNTCSKSIPIWKQPWFIAASLGGAAIGIVLLTRRGSKK